LGCRESGQIREVSSVYVIEKVVRIEISGVWGIEIVVRLERFETF